MNISIDEASEQRIKREIELGHFSDPAEVVARALELLEAQEAWLHDNQELIRFKIERSFAQIEQGEGIPGDEARRILEAKKQRG